MEHLPERQRPGVQAILRRAYRSDVPTARRLLHDLVRRLEDEHPSAAWRGGKMMLRWVAAGVLEAVKGFRRLKGHRDMPTLVATLRARDQQLGLATAEQKVASGGAVHPWP